MRYAITLVALFTSLTSCGRGLNYADRFPYGKGYVLLSQSGKPFPLDSLRGKVLVVGYIYTNCPDICPFITNNMKKVQKAVNSSNEMKEKVMFVSISFDPRRDNPERLKEYARLYKIDTTNWVFLTGDEATVDSLMKDLAIVVEIGPVDVVVRTDTVEDEVVVDTTYRYEILHTDRIHVIAPDGRIVEYFKGSEVETEEVLKAIRKALR